MEVCQNILVPALDAGPQKNRPYQSDIYTVSFHAIPRQAREQDSFDTVAVAKVYKFREFDKSMISYMFIEPVLAGSMFNF